MNFEFHLVNNNEAVHTVPEEGIKDNVRKSTKKSNSQKVQCEECLEFKSKSYIAYHKSIAHRTGKAGHQCYSCPSTFMDKNRLMKHYKTAHDQNFDQEDELFFATVVETLFLLNLN